MTMVLAIAGWLGFASVAWLSVARNRIAESMMDKLGDTVQRLYQENCNLRNTLAEKDAELDRIGVRRNAKGRLEPVR